MMAVASVSILDGLICSLTHCVTLSLEASRYTIFGINDESSQQLIDMNVEGELNTVLTFLETEKNAIKSYRPAHACAECIQNTTMIIRKCLDDINRKIQEHNHMILKHWYSAGCAEDFAKLKTLMQVLNKDFKLLLKIFSVRN